MGSAQHTPGFCMTVVSLFLSASSAREFDIRLDAFESTRCSGIVQIFHNNAWGSIGSGSWHLSDTTVACRELACGSAVCASHLDRETGQIWLVNLNCSGEEPSLAGCQHSGIKARNSGPRTVVGVVCSDGLPSPNMSISPAGALIWGQDVHIMCSVPSQIHQLARGYFTLTKDFNPVGENWTSRSNRVAFTIIDLDFEHEGCYRCCYQTTKFSSPADLVEIAVQLPQPNISLASPETGLLWGPGLAAVTAGSSFVFSCSAASRYPTGHFVLIAAGSNVTRSESAVDRSASFTFAAAEFEHEGNYSCVYVVTQAARTTGPTATIRLLVQAPLVLVVSSAAAALLLLLLLALLSACLLRRRRREAPVLTQMTLKSSCEEDEDDGDEVDADYVNVEWMDIDRERREEAQEAEDDCNNADYENMEAESEYIEPMEIRVAVQSNREEEEEEEEESDDDEETSDDDNDYVNVTKPPSH